MYDGPAGVVLTRDDVKLILQWSPHDNTPQAVELRRRMIAFQESTWQQDAERRADAMRRCIPVPNS